MQSGFTRRRCITAPRALPSVSVSTKFAEHALNDSPCGLVAWMPVRFGKFCMGAKCHGGTLSRALFDWVALHAVGQVESLSVRGSPKSVVTEPQSHHTAARCSCCCSGSGSEENRSVVVGFCLRPTGTPQRTRVWNLQLNQTVSECLQNGVHLWWQSCKIPAGRVLYCIYLHKQIVVCLQHVQTL